MELQIVDNIKFMAVLDERQAELAENIYKAAAKYIEERHGVKVNIRSYNVEGTGKRIEFNIITRMGFDRLGEAVEFIAKYLSKRKEIEEDFSRLVSFYSQIIKEVGIVGSDEPVQRKNQGENKEPTREV